MSLPEVSISRPVLTVVMTVVIVLFGMIGFNYLGVRQYPSIDPPVISVTANYVGANADVIESQITEPLEESINGVSGIETMTSTSTQGRANIRVEFSLAKDLDDAASDVRGRVSRAMDNLPEDAPVPEVAKSDADASPIIFLMIQSKERDLVGLTDIATNVFKERMQTIPGVSRVQIWGEKTYAMRLRLDPAQLAAYGLAPTDVRDALNQENVELPSGVIEGHETELAIRTQGQLRTEQEFNNLIIKENDSKIVRLRDVGRAELGAENEKTILRRNNVPMVGIVLEPQPGANQVDIAQEFYDRLDQMQRDLPEDLILNIGFDETRYILASIEEVQMTIFIAFALVVAVIFLFLRNFRSTLIPVLAIPVSLIGAFFGMYLAGFSINVLTLLGLVLATGLVVDDAIVMLENIYKKIEDGQPPIEAGKAGSREIFFAILATTGALISVFLPIIFLEGLVGRLFVEFGVTLASAVVISSFVSLTLTPMLCSRLLKSAQHQGRFYRVTERFFVGLNTGYARTLRTFLRARWLAFPIMIAAAALSYFLWFNLPSELAPMEDRSKMRAYVTGPQGASYEYMDRYMKRLVSTVNDTIEETNDIIAVTSPSWSTQTTNSGFMRLRLVPPAQREKSQMEVANELNRLTQRLNGAQAYVSQEQTISVSGGGGGLPVQFVLQAPNFEKLRAVLPEFEQRARASEKFNAIDINLKFNKPELNVELDRERARELGVSARDIAMTLQAAFSNQRFGYFTLAGKQYKVIGRLHRADRDEPVDLRTLNVRSNEGQLVQLDQVVELQETVSPPQIFHFNRSVSATVSGALAQDVAMQEGIEEMRRIGDEVLGEDFTTALDGASRDFVESSNSLLFAFVLALLLVYLTMSAQFESFADPLVIMLTVPLAIGGALGTLWLTGQTLNVFSQIGLIMLIGLVTKNAILIVEFANQLKQRGRSVFAAAREAAELRFRPILMTSLATILGAVPIAMALGAGAESRKAMGTVLIGGLIFSGLLTLYVIPALYSYISRPAQPVRAAQGGNGTGRNDEAAATEAPPAGEQAPAR